MLTQISTFSLPKKQFQLINTNYLLPPGIFNSLGVLYLSGIFLKHQENAENSILPFRNFPFFFFFLVLLGDQHSFGILTLRGKSSMCLKSLKFTISSLLPCMRTKSSVGFSVPHQQPYAWDKPRFSPLATFRIGRYPYLIFSSSLKGFLPTRILVSIIPIAFKSLYFLTLIVSYSEVEMCQAIYFCKWTMIIAQWFHYCAIIFSHIAKVSQDC